MTVYPKTDVDDQDTRGVLADMMSAVSGITASATSNQAGATPLTRTINRITTVASAGDSVRLPAALPGAMILVKNTTATSMDVFPATGENINALADNAAFAVGATTSRMFFCALAGTWETL